MNQFKMLDHIFPCTPNRKCGEVVSITLNLSYCGWLTNQQSPSVSGKRKAWYCNASVNAFHLHRQLCRDVSDQPWFDTYPRPTQRRFKKLIGLVVAYAYMANAMDGTQYLEIDANLGNDSTGGTAFERNYFIDFSVKKHEQESAEPHEPFIVECSNELDAQALLLKWVPAVEAMRAYRNKDLYEW